MKYFIVLFFIVFSFSSMSFAQCYSRVEAEADQGIRIHSELMVVGLNCQAIGQRNGLDLYGDYRKFTGDNAELFSRYEQILMAFYKKNDQHPKKELHNLRTNYANAISKVAASRRPDVFCAQNAERIEKAKEMNMMALRRWASTLYPSHPVSYPLCKS